MNTAGRPSLAGVGLTRGTKGVGLAPAGLTTGIKGVGLAPAVISLMRGVAVAVTVTSRLPTGATGDNWEPPAGSIGTKGWETPAVTPGSP